MAEFVIGTGIWITEPSVLERPFPYLRLLQALPEEGEDPGLEYHFGVALAQSLEDVAEGIEQEDRYLEAANALVYYLPGATRRLRRATPARLAVALPNRINPPVLEPALTTALDKAVGQAGIPWSAGSLRQTRRDNRFTTLETPVPTADIGLELDGITHPVAANSFIAAGLRLALVETGRIANIREFLAGMDE